MAVMCVAGAVWFFPSAGVESSLTFKDYEEQLSSAQQREKVAKEEIATEQGKIESTKQQIAEADQQISTVMSQTYALAGTDPQGVAAAESEASSIQQGLEALLSLTPEDLAKRQSDISALRGRIAALASKPLAKLTRIADRLAALTQLAEQVSSRAALASAPEAPAVASDKTRSYTVKLVRENRECLYRISGYDFVFGDPAKWPYLYRANQSIIDKGYQFYKRHNGDRSKYARSADLIFPGQVLDIPR